MARKQTDQVYEAPVQPVDILAKRRNCTDIICLLLFIIFILVQVGVSIFAYVNGDPRQLVLPHDSNGRLCTSPKANLFFFNLLQCININALLTGCPTPQICVADCPSSNLYYLIPDHRTLLLQNYCKSDDLIAIYGSLPSSSQVSISNYSNLIAKNICPSYVLSSKPLFQRCLPSIISDAVNTVVNITAYDSVTNTNTTIYDNQTGQPVTNQLISKAIDYLSKLLNIKTVAQFVLEDFYHSAVLIIVLLLIAAVVSFIYIVITRWIVGPMIALMLIGIIGLLSFAIWFCTDRYLNLRNNNESTSAFQLKLQFDYYTQLAQTWLAFAIIAGIILLIILLIILVLIKRLRLAVGLIREASKAVTELVLIVFWPILPFAMQMAGLAFNITVAVYLASAAIPLYRVTNTTALSVNATFKPGDACNPSTFNNQSQNATCVFYKYGYNDPFSNSVTQGIVDFLNNYQWLPQFYNLFMFFWIQAFIIG